MTADAFILPLNADCACLTPSLGLTEHPPMSNRSQGVGVRMVNRVNRLHTFSRAELLKMYTHIVVFKDRINVPIVLLQLTLVLQI